MKYCTDDGKRVFDTEQEVFDYEEKLKAEKEKKAKLAEEKRARKDEIKADYEALLDKVERYKKDYAEPVKISRCSFPIPNLFYLMENLL